MRFLIAGFGSAGRRHMHNLNALGEKDIFFYRTRRSTLDENELANVIVETDLKMAFDHQPDAVIIANPTAYHMDVAIPAAEAGCHILLEKPISHNLERIDELKVALKHGGGQLLVGFQLRFHPSYLQVKRWLEAGEIGKPLSARAHYGDYLPGWHPWEDYRQSYSARSDMGGGVVTTLCHPLDYLRWLLGEVDSLLAMCGKVSALEIDVEDTAEIVLDFRNGAIGSVHLDYYQQPPSCSFEIIGSEGTIRWHQDDNAARLYKTKTGKWEIILPPPNFERNDLFLDEMRHFLQVARNEAQPQCNLMDGETNLKTILAAYESSKAGKRITL